MLREDLFRQHKKFISEIEHQLCSTVEAECSRFPSADKLLKRFRVSAENFLRNKPQARNEFREIHNELCVAVNILASPDCIKLDYEPLLTNCAKRIDFHATISTARSLWIEVKTIHPSEQDDWSKLEKMQKDARLPNNVCVIMDKNCLGGELWHNAYASRSKMLEYTIEMEYRIASCNINTEKEDCILAFFSNGFKWHIDELEDFIAYYRTNAHRDDDPFREMEEHFIKINGSKFRHNIRNFAFFCRRSSEVIPSSVVIDVKPPLY